MRLIEPPSDDSYASPARTYRVTYWQKQLPPPGSSIAAEQMAWSAVHFDFAEAEDVHEVIEWADAHFDENTSSESERGYQIGIWTPDGLLNRPTLIFIAGFDPSRADPSSTLRPRP
jgi:hypothetical protein